VPPTTKILLAPLPADLQQLGQHPLVHEKLMPSLGLVRARSAQHGIDAAVVVTEHGRLGHTAAIYANDDDVIAAYARAVRTGRILVNAPRPSAEQAPDQPRTSLQRGTARAR
jgi:acetaldehyde dehydrogenase/alcohol dehydrogenase